MKSALLRLLFCFALQKQPGMLVSAAIHRPKPPPLKDGNNKGATAEATAAVASIVTGSPKTLLEKVPYLAVAALLGVTMDPLVERFFNATRLKHEKGDYKETLVFAGLESIDLGAKAYAVTLLVDFIQTLLPTQLKHFLPFPEADLFAAAPRIGMVIWAAKSISSIKSLLLHKAVHGTRLGKVAFVEQLLNLSIGVGTVYNVLHHLKINVGMGFGSLFAASGVSAIVFSLASKGIVEQMVGGLLLQAWDAIEVGEYVRLGDGTEGTIVYIGLLETEVLGSDHVPIRVPNSQIVGKRVSMLSKVTKSQVKQILRFKYSDMDKLPKLIKDIEQEIIAACSDGDDNNDDTNSKMNKPPQVVLAQYEADHIQVAVSCSFDIKPGSSEFAEMREKVLFAIANAVKKNRMEFAIPAIQYETANGLPHPGVIHS